MCDDQEHGQYGTDDDHLQKHGEGGVDYCDDQEHGQLVLMIIIFRNMVRVVHAFKPAKVAQSNDLDLETLPESFR